MGESFENFRGIVQAMQAADAVRIVSSAMLSGALIELLLNDVEARAMGERGRDVFAAQAGATTRTVHSLLALLKVTT
jgi:3-deoxy-D-manno-octulosonic-acid transferase